MTRHDAQCRAHEHVHRHGDFCADGCMDEARRLATLILAVRREALEEALQRCERIDDEYGSAEIRELIAKEGA